MDADRLARLDELLDRQDILDCLTRFSRGIDRFDKAAFLSAFHPDAIIAAGPFVGGPVELYDWARGLHDASQSATQHNLVNVTYDISGDIAHTETYYLYVGRNRDETNWIAGGRYLDRLERRNGAWRIAFRTNAIEWSGNIPSTALPFSDVADIHGNGVPTRGMTDPSYSRPLTNKRALRSMASATGTAG